MRKAIWIAVLLIVVIYVAIAFATLDRRSDQAQVDALIARGTEAVQNRDLRGVISCISTDYKDEAGLGYDRLRILLAQAMRNETDYTVTVSNRATVFDADEATVALHVTLNHPLVGAFYDRDLKLVLAKERAYHMLILPTHQWRVVSSEHLGLPSETEF